jgi:AsmA family protein
MRFILKTIGATLLAILLLVVAIVAFFDWDAMRPEIEQRISDTLGRDVRIEGPLDVRLGLRPHVVASQVSIANAPWGRAPALLEAERVDASLRLWPLFRGRLEVVEAGVDGGTLALEQNEAGEQNWDFLPEREEDDAPPGFERLDIADVAVSFDDHARDGVIRGGIERLAIETEEEAGPLAVSGTGQLEQRPFSVELDLGAEERTPAAQEERFPISGTMRYGNQTIQLNGRAGPGRQLAGGGIELQAKGDHLHADLAALGIEIGPLPPYEASAVLEFQEDGRYRVHELRMVVGQSQLAAEGTVSLAEPPAARGAIHVARLHLPDLEGVITATDPDAPGFPETPLPVDLLRRAEVSLDLRIDEITGAHERLEGFGGGALAVELQGGVLRVPPFALALDGAKLQGEATLDASVKVPTIEAALSVGKQSLRIEGRAGPEGIPARGRYTISAQGRGLHEDLAALGIETAPLPPYKASAVAQLEPQGVQLDAVAARFGESQLSGKAFVATDPLAVRADLHVARLHLEDFAFDPKKESAKGKPQKKTAYPLQTALPVEWLREGRLALDLRIDEITGGLEPLGQTRLAAELKEGVLRVSPLRGAVNDTSLEVHATLDATEEQPAIDAHLTYGGHHLQLKGRTGPQARLAGGSFRLFAKGKEPLPPYEASAVLQVGEEEVRLQKLAASLGESQLSGSATVSLEPPALRADLAVPRLHMPDLHALRTEEADEGAPGLLDRPLPVDLLRRAQAAVDMRVERITNGEVLGALLDSVRLSVAMKDGVLRVSPLAAEASQGTLEAYATLDATVEPPTVGTKVSFTGVRLEEVLDEVKDDKKPQDEDDAPVLEQITGSLGGSAELSGAGRSPREILANLNGSFGVAMEGGTMSYVADRLAALDLAGVAKWLAGDDEPIELQCMISLFDVEQGVARPSLMLLASEDTDIWGEGEINLREGTVDLELEAEPRDPRIGVLRSPIRIGGDLASPSIGPAAGPLAGRGATAAILGAVAAPIAALLGTLTTGPGEETVCKDYWSAISQVHEGTLPEKK